MSFKITKTQNFVCLTASLTLIHSLTRVARPEAKQNSKWPSFCSKRINSLVGCALWGPDECAPSAPCLYFDLLLGYP